MKFVRYRHQGKTSYGMLEGEKIKELSGLPLKGPWKAGSLVDDFSIVQTGGSADIGSVELLCPCEPSKILAIGLNYKSHLEAQSRQAPKNPEIFIVPTSALLQPGGEIRIPPDAHNVHYEGELAIVIGRESRRVPVSAAESCILGFTCGNDISERYWQKNDLQWWRAKGSDTFAPLGPVITSDFDWRHGRVETKLNGSVVQAGNFSELLFDPTVIISYASQYVTLYPGDVIYTGTPGDTGPLKPGDLVEIEIPGIGVLSNRVTG
jgi:2-keto-4-pentenoate hydratase/2-oxohepta-3-ene-1,7-dioic acid hydratase in catechol pathway